MILLRSNFLWGRLLKDQSYYNCTSVRPDEAYGMKQRKERCYKILQPGS